MVRAYRPSESAYAVLFASMTEYADFSEQASAIINFYFGLLDEESARHLRKRLMAPDRVDPFDLEAIQEQVEYLIEEWTGRPTQPSPASTPSQRRGGAKSTAHSRRAASTRSTSRPTASAT